MNEPWNILLPSQYRNRVIPPLTFEHHAEPVLRADKIIGFDDGGKRCFYYHSFLLTEEGFDIDEFPILIEAYYEVVIAWRHQKGHWIKVKSYSNKLDRCNKSLTTLPVELSDEMPC
jgi:hypothetical protein